MPSPATRTRRPSPAQTGRFARSAATQRPRPSTRRPATRRTPAQSRRGIAGGWLQRGRPQQQSGLKRALSGALPGMAKGGSSAKSGKAAKGGGVALLAGAAGLLFKNRDKVASMVKREPRQEAATPVAPVPPASPSASSDAPIR